MAALKSLFQLARRPDEFLAIVDEGNSNVLHPEEITHDIYETARLEQHKSRLYNQ